MLDGWEMQGNRLRTIPTHIRCGLPLVGIVQVALKHNRTFVSWNQVDMFGLTGLVVELQKKYEVFEMNLSGFDMPGNPLCDGCKGRWALTLH